MKATTLSPPPPLPSSRVQRELAHLADQPRLASAREISAAIGISEPVLYSLVRQGKFPCIHINRMVRFDASEVARFLTSSQEEVS